MLHMRSKCVSAQMNWLAAATFPLEGVIAAELNHCSGGRALLRPLIQIEIHFLTNSGFKERYLDTYFSTCGKRSSVV